MRERKQRHKYRKRKKGILRQCHKQVLKKKEPEKVNGNRKKTIQATVYRRVGQYNYVSIQQLAHHHGVYPIIVHEDNRYNAADLFCCKEHKPVSIGEELPPLKCMLKLVLVCLDLNFVYVLLKTFLECMKTSSTA